MILFIRIGDLIGNIGNLVTLPKVKPPAAKAVGAKKIIRKKSVKQATVIAKVNPPYIPEPIRREISPAQQYSTDTLDVSERRIRNQDFVEEPNRGISVYRPEIISLLNFKPIFTGDPKLRNLNSHGRLIEVQHQTSYLRRDILSELLANLQNASETGATDYFAELKNKALKEFKNTEKLIKFYKEAVDNIELLQSFFDLKRMDLGPHETNEFLSLREFFNQIMGYTDKQFNSFTGTKILAQLLFDFKAVAENYSINLLNLDDKDRKKDSDPVVIDDTYTLTDGFTFTVEQIRSEINAENATNASFFNSFLNSLPKSTDDRIKILTTILSKEYKVSRALGTRKIQKKLQKYFDSESTGSPFDNIIGITGGSIFDQPAGPESLTSFLQLTAADRIRQPTGELETERDFFILPFEEKYIDSDETDKTYIPGKSYFVDSIFDLKNVKEGDKTVPAFNINSLVRYSRRFNGKNRRARGVINNLLKLRKNSRLDPERMFDTFLASVKASMDGINERDETVQDQMAILAIFKLANRDNILKRRLFQYLLLVGLQTNEDNDLKSIWTELASEFRDATNIPEVEKLIKKKKGIRAEIATETLDTNLLAGPQTVLPFILGVAKKTEKRVRKLILSKKGEKPSASLSSKKDTKLARNLERKKMLWSVIQKGSLKDVLMAAPNSSNNNLIKEFINLTNKFTSDASRDGFRSYLVPDGSGRTRFNFLSTSTQMLLIFEILCNFVEKYTSSEFADYRRELIAKCNKKRNQKVKQMMDEISGENEASRGGSDIQEDLATTDKITKSQYYTLGESVSGGRKFLTKFKFESKPDNQAQNINTRFLELLPGDQGVDIGKFSTRTLPLRNNFLEFKSILSIPASKQVWNRIDYKLRRDLRSNRAKLETEDLIVSNILYLLETIANRLIEAKNNAQRYYGPTSRLNAFREYGGTLEDLRAIKNPAQLMTSTYLLDSLVAKTSNAANIGPSFKKIREGKVDNIVISENVFEQSTKEAVYAYLSKDIFQEKNQASDKIKIVSVGIPSGFIKSLVDRVDFEGINKSSFKKKQVDVVKINVYKRDIRFDDIIFKPRKFIFDLSLFQRENEIAKINLPPGSNFSKYLQGNAVADYSSLEKQLYAQNENRQGAKSIDKDEKYKFLTQNEKLAIIENHFKSFLLDVYINLSTGLKINEETFIIDPLSVDQTLDLRFEQFILLYVKDVLKKSIPNNQNIQQLLANETVDEDVKDILRFVNFGSVIFSPQNGKDRIMRPKMFDRVFHLPINIDDFEIEPDETRSTTSGKRALEQAYLEKLIVKEKEGDKEKFYLKRKEKGDIVFEDYFVSIENEI